MVKVFIIILNWNGAEDTLNCLKSLEKLKKDKYSLTTVVVDNASSDDSVTKLRKYMKVRDGHTLIINKSNLGYAGGMNSGLTYSLKKRANYVMCINNDTIVDKYLIEKMIVSTGKKKNIGIICPKIYFAKGYEFHKKRYKKSELGKVIWYAGGEIDWDNIYGSNRGVDEVDEGQFEKEEETDFATGNCMLINVKALKDIGFFNEKYFLYLEDMELSIRMKNAGWKILYSPKGYLWHKVAQSSGIGSDLNDYYTTRNRMLFGYTYASTRTKLALFRESIKLLISGREWQRTGIKDFYLRKFGKGSWK